MKYVMFRLVPSKNLIRYTFMIFPDLLVHQDVANTIRRIRHGDEKEWCYPQPVSAGFCIIHRHEFSCSGKSESLGMASHEDDTRIINEFGFLFGMGYSERKEIVQA